MHKEVDKIFEARLLSVSVSLSLLTWALAMEALSEPDSQTGGPNGQKMGGFLRARASEVAHLGPFLRCPLALFLSP